MLDLASFFVSPCSFIHVVKFEYELFYVHVHACIGRNDRFFFFFFFFNMNNFSLIDKNTKCSMKLCSEGEKEKN